jgi:hypothetical protein
MGCAAPEAKEDRSRFVGFGGFSGAEANQAIIDPMLFTLCVWSRLEVVQHCSKATWR